MSYAEHQRAAGKITAACAVITLSDTRSEATDGSGAIIKKLLGEAGHRVVHYQIIPDEPAVLAALLDSLLGRLDVQVILTNGGTGISRRDQTMPVIEGRMQTVLPGFGELFRMLSFEQIGGGAMASRAAGGVSRGKLLFAMPGSTAAVELAMTRLIVPELGHLLHDLGK